MIVGVGCDIVKINRFSQNTEALAQRILSNKERELFYTYSNQRQLEYLQSNQPHNSMLDLLRIEFDLLLLY